jgi:signal transduction histidine kinase
VAEIAGIRNFHRLGLLRPNKAEGMAADLHVAEGLGDLRHVAGDAIAAGASRGVMGVLLDCCRMRPVLCIGAVAGKAQSIAGLAHDPRVISPVRIVTIEAGDAARVHEARDEVVSLHAILMRGPVGKVGKARLSELVLLQLPEVRQLKQGKRRHYEAVRQYRRKDGTVIWGHSYLSVVHDAETRPKMFIGTAIDVTEARRAQDALRETQSKLERVTRLTTMHTVTASIAHEVNQPLAAIVANGKAALRWLRRSPPEIAEAVANVNQIISDGYRASHLVTSVRGMFKKDDRAVLSLNVNEVVEEVLALLRSELNSRRVSLRTDLGSELPKISADRVQLQQVMLNLIMNAGEAMGETPDGSRMLRIRTEASRTNEVVIAVEDSGPGIDPTNINRIFDAFFTTKPQGMGMGLSICRSIIESHGGQLWASARQPSGSIFYVKLPNTPLRNGSEGVVG